MRTLLLKGLIITLLLPLLLAGCDVPLPAPATAGPPAQNWYSLYFTSPHSPTASQYEGGPDEALAQAIQAARLSVDVAAYELNIYSLQDALITAHRRGVTIRMVTESDNSDEPAVQRLREAGIEVLGDRREGLMHNKFVVIDRMEVWTGSMNFTVNGAYRNDNHLVRLRSSQLAQDYTREFEEMFVDDRFGPGSPADTPHPSLTIHGTHLEVYFSPEDGTRAHLLDLVASAQESIFFLAYSFTSDELADALIERAGAGVSVAGVMEESQYRSNTGSEFDTFIDAGLDVRLDGNPRNMHHKVLIIDSQVVVAGSYNFSSNGETFNDENTLIIYNSDIAGEFLQEFERVFKEARE